MRVWWILGLLLWAVPAVGRAALFDLDVALEVIGPVRGPAPVVDLGSQIELSFTFDDSDRVRGTLGTSSFRVTDARVLAEDPRLNIGDAPLIDFAFEFPSSVSAVNGDQTRAPPDLFGVSLGFEIDDAPDLFLSFGFPDREGLLVLSTSPLVIDPEALQQVVGRTSLVGLRSDLSPFVSSIEVEIVNVALRRRDVSEPAVWVLVAMGALGLGLRRLGRSSGTALAPSLRENG